MTKNEIIGNMYLKMALEVSKLSKCVSHQVRCIIVKDGRPLVNGYNGTPSGYINCNNVFDKHNFNREMHISFSDKWRKK